MNFQKEFANIEAVKAVFDDYCQSIKQLTIITLGNATSNARDVFNDCMERWTG